MRKPENPAEWPLWSHDDAEGECKYIRLASGGVLLIDPTSYSSHRDVAELLGLRDQVVSAGQVSIDRQARTVVMADRDSWTLRIKSMPGEQDAEAVRLALFGQEKARKAKTRGKRRAS